jgi:hypothetical protein
MVTGNAGYTIKGQTIGEQRISWPRGTNDPDKRGGTSNSTNLYGQLKVSLLSPLFKGPRIKLGTIGLNYSTRDIFSLLGVLTISDNYECFVIEA